MLNKKETEQIILTDSDEAISSDSELGLHENITAMAANNDFSKKDKHKIRLGTQNTWNFDGDHPFYWMCQWTEDIQGTPCVETEQLYVCTKYENHATLILPFSLLLSV
jgi:hypothetical protein